MSRKVSSLGVALGSFAAGILLASAANAVEPSGTAIRVDPAVNASGTGGDRLLELQGAVFMGDQIVASPNGLAQIKFVDDTRLVIGPNSRLKVDEFVFSPNNTAQKVTISALRGTFRFITGKSPHDAYEIRTPTMTIAVRGSIVEINVNSRNSSFRFREGSGVACDHSNNCIVADNACRIWYTPYNGTIGQATGVDLQRRLDVEYRALQE